MSVVNSTPEFGQFCPAAKSVGALKKISSTGHGTGGTRKAIAHGLGRTPKVAIAVPTAADADGAITAYSVHIVKVDATNVTIRCSAVSGAFDLYVG